MEGYYLLLSAACLLSQWGAVLGWEDMCVDISKSFTQSVSLSHQSYPEYTDRKHCQCNVTTEFNADVILQLQLHREAFEPAANSGCSPRLMVAVVDRQMQESEALRAQEMEGILRPSVGVCPMPHAGPYTATRSYVTMRSSQQLTVTFQNPSAHMTRFYVNLSASPAQKVKVACGSLVIPPPILMEGGALTPVGKRGSEIGAIVACVIIGVFIIAIFIIAYCKVKVRDRNRSQSGTPTTNKNNRRSVTDGKDKPDKGRGNLGFEGTPRSSVGDVSNKNKPNDLNGTWQHPPRSDGVDNDLIPHDFLRRIASGEPSGGSPRHVTHYHHEPASVPVRSEPNILSPARALTQPGYPHQPILDPIFTETPDRDPRSSYPRGSRVSFPDVDQDSFDSPYTKPVPGSPSINAPSDSGYTGSDVHFPSNPNHEDTTSDISGPDDRPLNPSPDSGRPTSLRSASPIARKYTPNHLPHQPQRNYTPDNMKKLPQQTYPIQPEYANLGFDPDDAEPMPSKQQPSIPIKDYPDKTSPFPTKQYPEAPVVIPMKEYPTQSAPLPVKEYPTEPVGNPPTKGISPAPLEQQPYNAYPDEPTKKAPKKKKVPTATLR